MKALGIGGLPANAVGSGSQGTTGPMRSDVAGAFNTHMGVQSSEFIFGKPAFGSAACNAVALLLRPTSCIPPAVKADTTTLLAAAYDLDGDGVTNEMTVGDYLGYVAQLRGVEPSQMEARVRKVEEQTALRDRHDDVIGTLSHGYRQRVGLAQALVHNPALLILDEPTSGLDPLMEAAFRETIEELRQSGTTVLLSSHILSEVEALCDRVTIIRSGRTVESGALADLRHLTRTSIDAELAGPPPDLAGLPGVHDLDVTGDRVRCQVDSDALDEVLRRLSAAGVRSLVSQPPTLEELFLMHYGPEEARS
jgi:ABC-type multidrug transport system ATPase subunit